MSRSSQLPEGKQKYTVVLLLSKYTGLGILLVSVGTQGRTAYAHLPKQARLLDIWNKARWGIELWSMELDLCRKCIIKPES